MNRRIFIQSFLIFWLIVPPQVLANNQGFTWEVNTNTRLEVSVEYLSGAGYGTNYSMYGLTSDNLFLNITNLPNIPDDVDSIPYFSSPSDGIFLPLPTFEITRINKTEIHPGWLNILIPATRSSLVAVPIGNWGLLSNIVNDFIELHLHTEGMQVSLIDTSTRWGWRKVLSWEGHYAIEEREVFKVDGTLAMFHSNATDWAELPTVGLWRNSADFLMERLDGPSEGTQYPVLEIILGIGIIALIAIVILIKYRSK